MARIAVVTSSPPLTEGGHLVIARSLVSALEAAGHRADLVLTPQNRFGRQATAYLANWFTDVGVTGDGAATDEVISLRFPSYAVRHRVHVCWLNHRMREYYDLWERFAGTLSRRGRLKEGVRRWIIHRVDRHLLTRNVTRLYAQSRNIQSRLRRFGRIDSEVLYPPPPPRPYRCDGYGDYLFTVSRLAPLKRVDLLLQALAQPAARGVRLVVGGSGAEDARLRELARALGVEPRVTFAGRLSDGALVDHLARCRAVCFVPQDEDYGFVTAEAFASRKAVVTCRDSGGPTELVQDGTLGFVVDPSPGALAAALARLVDDRALAERQGAAAAAVAAEMTWPRAIEKLVIV
jgi:glycosyltransferase involved in cell wall biosynthesis